MRRTPKLLSVWASGLIAAVILVAGCGGPSLPDREEAAGLSVRENPPSAAPTGQGDPAESQAIATESTAESAAVQGGGAGATENGQPRQSEVPASQPPSSAKPEAPSSPSPSPNAAEKETRTSKPSPTETAVASQASETPKLSSEEASPISSPKVDKAGAKGGGEPETLKFAELYGEVGVRGMKLSDKVQRLDGQKVEMTGFMAPPLSATVHFFVLTKVALTICPFCSTDADWPSDIVVVFMPEGKEIKPTEHQVRVTGTLSVGSQTDDETGFVSLIRIMADKTEVLK